MLQRIEIKNFQSHKNTSVDFCSGMSVITGSSDYGKSAIIRAMLWAINNRPSGEAFKSWVSDKEDSVEVAMEFDNDWFIKKREKGKNIYICEAGQFEALRSNVPDVIQAISNITDYNIQTQFNPYFMLQDSPGDRAKKLNELVGLDIIDRVFKKLNKKITDTKTEITRLNKEITSLKEEIEGMSYLEFLAPKIVKLDDDIAAYTVDCLRANLLASLQEKLIVIDSEIAKQTILKAEPTYKELIQKISTFQIEKTSLADLRGTLGTLQKIENNIRADTEWLAVEEPYLALKVKIDTYYKERDKIISLNRLYTELHQIDHKIETETSRLELLELTYDSELKAAKVCPTCGRPL